MSAVTTQLRHDFQTIKSASKLLWVLLFILTVSAMISASPIKLLCHYSIFITILLTISLFAQDAKNPIKPLTPKMPCIIGRYLFVTLFFLIFLIASLLLCKAFITLFALSTAMAFPLIPLSFSFAFFGFFCGGQIFCAFAKIPYGYICLIILYVLGHLALPIVESALQINHTFAPIWHYSNMYCIGAVCLLSFCALSIKFYKP